MEETIKLSNRADGRITAGLIPIKTINPRYPLAPPCPTEEYRKAITSSKGIISKSGFKIFFLQNNEKGGNIHG